MDIHTNMEKEAVPAMKKRIRMTVAYDGTNYHGWQQQNNGITIEEELNRHLSELLEEPIQVIGGSRCTCHGKCGCV